MLPKDTEIFIFPGTNTSPKQFISKIKVINIPKNKSNMFVSKCVPKAKKSNHPAFIDKTSHVDETIRHVRATLDRDPKRELS